MRTMFVMFALAERPPSGGTPRRNIVRIEVEDPWPLPTHLTAHGILAVPGSATSVRLVTHVDVDDADIDRVVVALEAAP